MFAILFSNSNDAKTEGIKQWNSRCYWATAEKHILIKKKFHCTWKHVKMFFLFIDIMNSLSLRHIFICLNSSSYASYPHTPWMLNLSSYYLFPISLSLPSIHLSSALERSLSLFLSKSIFSAVQGIIAILNTFPVLLAWFFMPSKGWNQLQKCRSSTWSACYTPCPPPQPHPPPQLARLDRSRFRNINNTEQWLLSKPASGPV